MSKDDFLGRWSKRKLAGEQEHAAGEEDGTAEVSETVLSDDEQGALPEDGSAALIDAESGDEQLEPHPAEGIDIEELEYDSDFTVFMHEKVPETLRRMALRKLWKSNPILANVDGLNDYDEDFSDATAIFINSTGGVISGTREQFMDDKQLLEGKDESNEDDTIEGEQETDAKDAEVSDAEDIDDIGDGEDELEPDTAMAAGEEQRLSDDADQEEISEADGLEKTEDNTGDTKT